MAARAALEGAAQRQQAAALVARCACTPGQGCARGRRASGL